MQRFVEADYYELDWYYEECADGKIIVEKSHRLPLRGERGRRGGERYPRELNSFGKVFSNMVCHRRD